MKPRSGLVMLASAAVTVLSWVSEASATIVFSDGFESYSPGAIDKNLVGGPNEALNGSGNPWFGPSPPNALVTGAESGVNPHSGSQMIKGGPLDAMKNRNWYNLAYREGSGSAYDGDIALDWWFYDPLGQGGADFKDSLAIGFYDTTPGDTDYPGNGNLPAGATKVARLSLGAGSLAGVDADVYQAGVVGATDGDSQGWLNIGVPRSVGWHHARIVVGPLPQTDANDVSFYIDDMTTPALVHSAVMTLGYNVIELNLKVGNAGGYFDDLSFEVIPEPATALLFAAAALILRRRRT